MKPDLAAIRTDLDSYLAFECAIHGGTGSGLQMCYSHEKGHSNLLEWLADGGLAALLAYIAELEAARQWVPVAERLPEPNEAVLVASKNRVLMGFYDTDLQRIIVYCHDKVDVTHWQPLPPLPEVLK
jgi:hypothetical protein